MLRSQWCYILQWGCNGFQALIFCENCYITAVCCALEFLLFLLDALLLASCLLIILVYNHVCLDCFYYASTAQPGSAGKPAIKRRNRVAACCTGQCADKLASESKEKRQASMGTGKSKPPWLCYVIIFLCKLVLCMLMGYWHVRVFVVFNRAARVVAVLTRWNLGLLCVFAPDLSVRREKSLWGSTPWRLCLEGTKRDMFARGPLQWRFL